MVTFKKYYIIRTDGKRQRYATTLRRLRSRGYAYNKKGRGWTKASPTGGGGFRPAPPTPIKQPPDEEFVEWTLHAKMDYGESEGARKGHEIFEEGSYTVVLPKGVEPDAQFMLQKIRDRRDTIRLPIISDLKFAGFEQRPTRNRPDFGDVTIGSKQNKNGRTKNY